ncbi:MAG: PorT family protein, partial [Muribaculaceae bacterium]
VMLQFIAPIINIGCDASVMYTHRQNRINFTEEGEATSGMTVNSDYIEVPINFRWNIGLPIVGKFVTPFLTTGPDFSFLVSNKNVKDAWNKKTFDFAWNFGVGLKLVDRVELAAAYGLGITSNASSDSALYGKNIADGKNRVWTVTAAYLF